MPCRVRAATQPLQALWITDDILAEAFQRFVRVSHATRRHGSNVPGPLEARRRWAKRRMGMAAVEPPPDSTLLNFGSVFGWGRWSRHAIEKGMKYEAPSRPPPPPAAATESAGYVPFGCQDDVEKGDSWAARIFGQPESTLAESQASDSHSAIELGSEILDTGIHDRSADFAYSSDNQNEDRQASENTQGSIAPSPEILDAGILDSPSNFAHGFDILQAHNGAAEESRKAFEALLTRTDQLNMRKLSTLKPLFRFLFSSLNEPEAHNTVHLLRWLKTGRPSQEVWRKFLTTVNGKMLHKGWICDEELSQIIYELSVVDGHHTTINKIAEKMATDRASLCGPVFAGAAKQILMLPDRTAVRTHLERLLHCLASLPHSLVGPPTKSFVTQVYSIIAPHLKPSELARHFAGMREDVLIRVLVEHWVSSGILDPPLQNSVWDDIDSNSRHTDGSGFVNPITDKVSVRSMRNPSMLMHAFRNIREHWAAVPSNPKWRRHRLLDLVAAMAFFRLPYTNTLREVFDLHRLRTSQSLTEVMFWDLRQRRHQLAVPDALAFDLMRRALQSGRYSFAYRVFKHVPSLSFVDSFQLPLEMVKNGKVGVSKLAVMLNRRTPKDVIPRSQRIDQRRAITEEAADLVALIAYWIARSPFITPRTSYRRVYELYEFLRDRLGVEDIKTQERWGLITRAFMHATVTRAFQENWSMSKTQMFFVLDLVLKTMGRQEAAALHERIILLRKRFLAASPEPQVPPQSLQYKRVEDPATHAFRWGHLSKRGPSEWKTLQEEEQRIDEQPVPLTGGRDLPRRDRPSDEQSRAPIRTRAKAHPGPDPEPRGQMRTRLGSLRNPLVRHHWSQLKSGPDPEPRAEVREPRRDPPMDEQHRPTVERQPYNLKKIEHKPRLKPRVEAREYRRYQAVIAHHSSPFRSPPEHELYDLRKLKLKSDPEPRVKVARVEFDEPSIQSKTTETSADIYQKTIQFGPEGQSRLTLCHADRHWKRLEFAPDGQANASANSSGMWKRLETDSDNAQSKRAVNRKRADNRKTAVNRKKIIDVKTISVKTD